MKIQMVAASRLARVESTKAHELYVLVDWLLLVHNRKEIHAQGRR
jgi:hypothetical protein